MCQRYYVSTTITLKPLVSNDYNLETKGFNELSSTRSVKDNNIIVLETSGLNLWFQGYSSSFNN